VLPAEHLLDLRRLDLRLERVQRALQIGRHVLARLGPLEEHTKIVELANERIAEIDLFAQAAAPLQQLLSFGLVGPEIWRADALLDVGELLGWVRGVKDSSAGLWRV
jgi:hypothetical protein